MPTVCHLGHSLLISKQAGIKSTGLIRFFAPVSNRPILLNTCKEKIKKKCMSRKSLVANLSFYNLLYVAVPVCFDQTFVEFTAWFL